MKKKFKFIINLLLIIGIGLVSFPIIKNTIMLVKFQQMRVTIMTELPTSSENESIHFPTLETYLTASPEKIGSAVGELTIPNLNIKLPIFAGLDNEQMLFGVGTMYPNRKTNKENLVMFGHHLGIEDLLLGKIKNLEIGDKISVTYASESLEYRVNEKKNVMETDLSILENSGIPRLTLITCDEPYDTDKRIVVTAELVKTAPRYSLKHPQKKQVQDMKMMKRSIVRYSILPSLVTIVIIIIGSYATWRYI